MKIEKGTGPQRCICCLRSKDEAIREHLQTMRNCENPRCPLHAIINEAIREKKKKRFVFGKPKPETPKFTFGPVQKPVTFTFGKPIKVEE